MDREQLIRLIQPDTKFLDDGEDISEYIRSLEANQPLDEKQIRSGYEQFKAEKKNREAGCACRKARSGGRLCRRL